MGVRMERQSEWLMVNSVMVNGVIVNGVVVNGVSYENCRMFYGVMVSSMKTVGGVIEKKYLITKQIKPNRQLISCNYHSITNNP